MKEKVCRAKPGVKCESFIDLNGTMVECKNDAIFEIEFENTAFYINNKATIAKVSLCFTCKREWQFVVYGD